MESLLPTAEWNLDFITLVCLSTLIASLGLVQNSTAVIIGAMLVAPLMMPLVCIGFALVEGNLGLIRTATRSTVFGFVVVFVIGYVIGFLLPDRMATPEMLNRGSPTLLDLGVAFCTGLAAAYAVVRLNLSSVLAGAGIAAALVPPIATSGIACGVGHYEVGAGAALLFVINVIAMVLGSTTCLWVVGIDRCLRGGRTERWARRVLVLFIFLALTMALPLSYMLNRTLPTGRIPEAVENALSHCVHRAGSRQISVTRTSWETPIHLSVLIAAQAPPGRGLARELARVASRCYGQRVRVRIQTVLVSEAHSPSPVSPDPSAAPVAGKANASSSTETRQAARETQPNRRWTVVDDEKPGSR